MSETLLWQVSSDPTRFHTTYRRTSGPSDDIRLLREYFLGACSSSLLLSQATTVVSGGGGTVVVGFGAESSSWEGTGEGTATESMEITGEVGAVTGVASGADSSSEMAAEDRVATKEDSASRGDSTTFGRISTVTRGWVAFASVICRTLVGEEGEMGRGEGTNGAGEALSIVGVGLSSTGSGFGT